MKTPHNQLQPIPVIRDAQPDLVEAVLMALEAQLALTRVMRCDMPLTLTPGAAQHKDVVHAVRLWASVHGMTASDAYGPLDVRIAGTRALFCEVIVPDDVIEVPPEAKHVWRHPVDEELPW